MRDLWWCIFKLPGWCVLMVGWGTWLAIQLVDSLGLLGMGVWGVIFVGVPLINSLLVGGFFPGSAPF